MSRSRSLNKVTLIGNLTRDPDIRKTSDNNTLCTFGIATNSYFNKEEEQLGESTEFHNIVTWNKLAEICYGLLKTGMLVYIEGELRTRMWKDEETGKTMSRTDIKAFEMKILDNKENTDEQS